MTSNINATVPPTNGPLVSAQIRDNFATAKAEISALQTAIAAAGDVDGPSSSTTGHLAVFADTTGKVIEDGGAPATGDVEGPGSSVAGHVAVFADTSGKVLSDGGAAPTGDVAGPVSSTAGHAAVFADGTGKVISDAGFAPVAAFPYGSIGAPPASASFSWVNQGGASVAQAGGTGTPIMLTVPDSNASLNWRGRFLAQPATPYTLTQFIRGTGSNNNSMASGVYFNDGTKWSGLEFLTEAADSELVVRKLTNSTTVSSTTVVSAANFPMPYGGWFGRLTNSGTTLTMSYSMDGYNFIEVLSEAIGSFITPTQVGFGGLCLTAGVIANLYVSLISWKAA